MYANEIYEEQAGTIGLTVPFSFMVDVALLTDAEFAVLQRLVRTRDGVVDDYVALPVLVDRGYVRSEGEAGWSITVHGHIAFLRSKPPE